VVLTMSAITLAREAVQEWELISPEGTIKVEPTKVNPHPSSLEGKTVVLVWNGKHNGDKFLNRVSELLSKQIPTIKVIKLWEVDPSTTTISHYDQKSKEWAKKKAMFKPDLVIATTAD